MKRPGIASKNMRVYRGKATRWPLAQAAGMVSVNTHHKGKVILRGMLRYDMKMVNKVIRATDMAAEVGRS